MSPQVVGLREQLHELCGRIDGRAQFMEVCGTHTVSIFRSGLRSVLPANLRLISGPGCPVCVTPQSHIDAAIELALRPDVIVASYGDMLRVPGRRGSLEQRRAQGAAVRVVSSARAALELARENPERTVVFLAVGFETTAPATAATVEAARRDGVRNFVVLVCHKLIVPAMLALLEAGDVPLDGFLCPGHVSVIIGAAAYRPIVERYGKPCVVAGFEPPQILQGLLRLVRQKLAGEAAVENVYAGVVTEDGNRAAQALLERVFVRAATPWRALGVIADSGLELAPPYRELDAIKRFQLSPEADEEHAGCRCGEVIQGKSDPPDCPLFGRTCTPGSPVGPCMVSSEGTCAAWYRYGRVLAW